MHTKALVELTDIFSSLTELSGIPTPPMSSENNKLHTCVDSNSVEPLLSNPDQQWKKGAFTQYPRPAAGLKDIPGHPPFSPNEHSENVMGCTISADKYHFTEWYLFDCINAKPDFNVLWGTELYDHSSPDDNFNDENVNLADKPWMKQVVEELRHTLQAGWLSLHQVKINTLIFCAILCHANST